MEAITVVYSGCRLGLDKYGHDPRVRGNRHGSLLQRQTAGHRQYRTVSRNTLPSDTLGVSRLYDHRNCCDLLHVSTLQNHTAVHRDWRCHDHLPHLRLVFPQSHWLSNCL